jgi:hypothetical protein
MRGTQQVGLLNLKIDEFLLLMVHLDDERKNEDEEGHAHNPSGLALLVLHKNFLLKQAVLEAALLHL